MADNPANPGLRPPDPLGSVSTSSSSGDPTPSNVPFPPQGSGPPPAPPIRNWREEDPPTQSEVTYTQPEKDEGSTYHPVLTEAIQPRPGKESKAKPTGAARADPEAGDAPVPLPGNSAREDNTYTEGAMHHPDSAEPIPMRPSIELVARVLENTIDRGLADMAKEASLALRTELGEKLLGWAGYYQNEDIVLARDRAVPVDSEAFNNALSLIVVALEVGFKDHKKPGPSMLPPHQWFRVADIVAAAMVRGALRSHQLQKGASFEFLSEGEHEDRLELNPAFETPATEGEALRALLEHLSGLLEGSNNLGYDANPENFYDYIKMRTRADLEALADADARAEMVTWRKEITAKVRLETVHGWLDRFAEALQSNKWADDVALDRIDDLHKGFAEGLPGIRLRTEQDFVRTSLIQIKHIIDTRGWDDPTLTNAAREIEAAFNARYTETYKAKIAEAEQLVQSEYATLLAQEREAMKLKVEVDVRNWSIGHKAERTATLLESMNSAVTNDDKIAVYAAAKCLGIPLKEDDLTRAPKLSQSARKRARKAKSVTGTIAAEDAKDAAELADAQRLAEETTAVGQNTGSARGRTPWVGHKRTASGSRSESVASSHSSDDNDTTPTATPIGVRGQPAQPVRPAGLPQFTPARNGKSSVHNPENQMDTEEDGTPQGPRVQTEPAKAGTHPVPTGPVAPAVTQARPGPTAARPSLTSLAFDNITDPNLLALARLVQTLINPLEEKIRAIDAKVNASPAPGRVGQSPPVDPRPRPGSGPGQTHRTPAAPSAAAAAATATQQGGPNPPQDQDPSPPIRRRPAAPSYANSARRGITVTSKAIRQHQALCYVTVGTFARRGLSSTAKTLRSLSGVRGSEF